MPFTPKPVAKSKISTIPTLARISEHDGRSALSNQLAVMVVVPPDGGSAWLIVAASFLVNFLIDGILYSFGIFLQPIADDLGVSQTEATLIGSLQMGMYYLSGPFTCAAVNRFGFRLVAVSGAIVAAAGLLAASFGTAYWHLLIAYGVLGGLGAGIACTPSIIIVSYYFERYRAIATGIAMCGSSAGIACLSPAFNEFIRRYGWPRTAQLQAALMFGCACLALSFRRIAPTRMLIEEDDEAGGAGAAVPPLDECADAISETSSQIEFSYIFAMMPRNKLIDMKVSASGNAALQPDEQRSVLSRKTAAVSMRTFRSRYVALYQAPMANRMTRWRRLRNYAVLRMLCCRTCCPNCVEATRTVASPVETHTWQTGPLNRQDIFYSGSLLRIPEYRNAQVDPQTEAATRSVETVQKACMNPQRLTNILRLLIDVSLLRSPTFAILLTMNFFYILGLLTPYLFLARRAEEAGIDAQLTMWLVAILSLGNMCGRLAAGLTSFWPHLDVVYLIGGSILVAALWSAVNAVWFVRSGLGQVVYAALLGFLLAFCPPLRTILYVRYLGLERLTNAFGLSMLVIGVAALLGAPAAGFAHTQTGDYNSAFLLSSACHAISGASLFALKPVHRWQTGRHGAGHEKNADARDRVTIK